MWSKCRFSSVKICLCMGFPCGAHVIDSHHTQLNIVQHNLLLKKCCNMAYWNCDKKLDLPFLFSFVSSNSLQLVSTKCDKQPWLCSDEKHSTLLNNFAWHSYGINLFIHYSTSIEQHSSNLNMNTTHTLHGRFHISSMFHKVFISCIISITNRFYLLSWLMIYYWVFRIACFLVHHRNLHL